MRVRLDDLKQRWVREDVAGCAECRTYEDNTAWLCGWHEGLAAGAAAVLNIATKLVQDK